jgi:hypothetical protein
LEFRGNVYVYVPKVKEMNGRVDDDVVRLIRVVGCVVRWSDRVMDGDTGVIDVEGKVVECGVRWSVRVTDSQVPSDAVAEVEVESRGVVKDGVEDEEGDGLLGSGQGLGFGFPNCDANDESHGTGPFV